VLLEGNGKGRYLLASDADNDEEFRHDGGGLEDGKSLICQSFIWNGVSNAFLGKELEAVSIFFMSRGGKVTLIYILLLYSRNYDTLTLPHISTNFTRTSSLS
jgi:hypothetical protein